jgi:hypothetical protein
MKNFIFFLLAAISTNAAFTQAKKPTIMVVPSDDWCQRNNFMMQYDNQGVSVPLPNYNKALLENSDLNSVISKIGELMAERGFPLVDLKSQLDKISKDKARTNQTGVSESPIDILNKTAKADILLKVFWKINEFGPQKSVEFRLQGFDAYSAKQIAASSGTSPQSFTPELSILLETAVLSKLDIFNSQLITHFDDLQTNGREGVLLILVGENSTKKLGDVYTFKGKEAPLKDHINKFWMPRNTVKGQCSMDENSDNVLKYSQVKIPLYGDDGYGGQIAYDFATWGDNLKVFLKSEFGIETTLQTKGLGEVELILN